MKTEKNKNFESDLGETGEVLEKAPEEDIEAIENESEVIKFSISSCRSNQIRSE